MAMEWLDRVPTKPGRIKITPEDGSAAWYAVMERADDPVAGQEGTPINAANLNAMQKISVEAEADTDYYIAVVGDDGVIRRGKQKSSDIPNGEEAVPLEEIAVTLSGPKGKAQVIQDVKQFDGGVIIGKAKPLAFNHNNSVVGATRLKCSNTAQAYYDVELPQESGMLALAHEWKQCTTDSVEVDEGTYVVLVDATDISPCTYSGVIVVGSPLNIIRKPQFIATIVSNTSDTSYIYFYVEDGTSKAYKLTCYANTFPRANWWYKKID